VNCKVSRGEFTFWKRLGFQETYVSVGDKHELLKLSTCTDRFSANAVMTNGISSSQKCIIYQGPFLNIPLYKDYQNDHEFVLHCFQGHPGSNSDVVEAELNQLASCKALLGTFQYKKDTIMFEENTSEIHEDVKAITTRGRYVLMIVVDYVFLLIMLRFNNLYAVSVSLSFSMFEKSFNIFRQELLDMREKNNCETETRKYQGLLSECDFMEYQLGDMEFIYLIPIHFENHWVIVMRNCF
jgi:hypothetical protein